MDDRTNAVVEAAAKVVINFAKHFDGATATAVRGAARAIRADLPRRNRRPRRA